MIVGVYSHHSYLLRFIIGLPKSLSRYSELLVWLCWISILALLTLEQAGFTAIFSWKIFLLIWNIRVFTGAS
jgi:hypothetical protein